MSLPLRLEKLQVGNIYYVGSPRRQQMREHSHQWPFTSSYYGGSGHSILEVDNADPVLGMVLADHIMCFEIISNLAVTETER